MKNLTRRLCGLVQWWMQLAPVRHRHWCPYAGVKPDDRCYHSSVCWYCDGLLCADQERKACPNCIAGKPDTCQGSCGQGGRRCTCGYGGGE